MLVLLWQAYYSVGLQIAPIGMCMKITELNIYLNPSLGVVILLNRLEWTNLVNALIGLCQRAWIHPLVKAAGVCLYCGRCELFISFPATERATY